MVINLFKIIIDFFIKLHSHYENIGSTFSMSDPLNNSTDSFRELIRSEMKQVTVSNCITESSTDSFKTTDLIIKHHCVLLRDSLLLSCIILVSNCVSI